MSRKAWYSKHRRYSVKCYDIERQRTDIRPTENIYYARNIYTVHGEEDDRDPNHVEKAFSKLEIAAYRICNDILEAQQAGESTFTICRADKDNILRKFLYLMLYRGIVFRDMYSTSIEDYKESDKERVVEFIQRKGFKNLKELWAHHLTVIMETTIDARGTWKDTVRKEMVHDNAHHFIKHCEDFCLTIVQPEAGEDEFILTENCFGIFEGNVDWNTPYGCQIFPYHYLAPISPRLALVLRRRLLFDHPIQDTVEEVAGSGVVRPEGMPPLRPSLLADLPVSLAVAPLDNSCLMETDEFVLDITKISTRHVHKINNIILTEARSLITYVSDTSMAASLEAWRVDDDFTPPLCHPDCSKMVRLRDQKLELLVHL